MAPEVPVDEARVDDDAEEGADVEEGGPDEEFQEEDAGGEDGDEETTISMIGPPPMSSPFLRASEKEPKKTSVWPPPAEAMTSVTPSVAETTV